MLTRLKAYLGIAMVVLAGIATGLAAIFRNQRDKAVAERETAETHLDKAAEANESHKKLNGVNDAIEKASDDIRNTPVDERRARLLKQSENYHGRKGGD